MLSVAFFECLMGLIKLGAKSKQVFGMHDCGEGIGIRCGPVGESDLVEDGGTHSHQRQRRLGLLHFFLYHRWSEIGLLPVGR